MSARDRKIVDRINAITACDNVLGAIALPGDWLAKGAPTAPIIEAFYGTTGPIALTPLEFYYTDGELKEDFIDGLKDESGDEFIYREGPSSLAETVGLIRKDFVSRSHRRPFAIVYILDAIDDPEEEPNSDVVIEPEMATAQ